MRDPTRLLRRRQPMKRARLLRETRLKPARPTLPSSQIDSSEVAVARWRRTPPHPSLAKNHHEAHPPNARPCLLLRRVWRRARVDARCCRLGLRRPSDTDLGPDASRRGIDDRGCLLSPLPGLVDHRPGSHAGDHHGRLKSARPRNCRRGVPCGPSRRRLRPTAAGQEPSGCPACSASRQRWSTFDGHLVAAARAPISWRPSSPGCRPG